MMSPFWRVMESSAQSVQDAPAAGARKGIAMAEFWTSGAGLPQAFMRRARRAEALGFDGVTVVDSQNLSGDCYIALGLAATETTRIKLGTGVTNPFTRHPAVT